MKDDSIMELRHLRYFVAVAEDLHFGRAAERLHISQPPLSQQIRALEEELSAVLFTRTSRQVSLTEAGRLFLPEARATLAAADRARVTAARAQRGEIGELAIGMFPSAPLTAPVAGLIRRFRAARPMVQLHLHERETRLSLRDLEEGRLEVAFLRYEHRPPLPPGFLVTEIMAEPLVLLLPRGHALARDSAPLPLAALRGESFVHFSARRGNALFEQFQALCRSAGFEPRIAQEANENTTILALVAADIGVSVLPMSVCRMAFDDLRIRHLDDRGAVTRIWLAAKRQPSSPQVRALLGLMRDEAPGGA